jgi:hypothetical protein
VLIDFCEQDRGQGYLRQFSKQLSIFDFVHH